MEGYVITPGTSELLWAVGSGSPVRFAAELDTGQGFVAFDGCDDLTGVPAGALLTTTGFFPFWRGIKRQVSNGHLAFSLIPRDQFDANRHHDMGIVEAATIVKDGFDTEYVFAQTDGVLIATHAVWVGSVSKVVYERAAELMLV